jgi:c-di-GMP-binding flagellar brake protein YcgR
MIEKFVAPGDKLELTSYVETLLPDGTEGVKTYKTTIHDIKDDDRLELIMPFEGTRLVLLPIDGEYAVRFHSKGGMYRSSLKIVGRDKKEGLYIMIAELTSNLHKYQRREYYRFNCAVEARAKQLDEEEIENFKKGLLDLIDITYMKKGIIVDISGGGARIVSDYQFEENSQILMRFKLDIGGRQKPFELVGRVIYSGQIFNRPGYYENRVKFEYINNKTREYIIKFIFNEERKNRKV